MYFNCQTLGSERLSVWMSVHYTTAEIVYFFFLIFTYTLEITFLEEKKKCGDLIVSPVAFYVKHKLLSVLAQHECQLPRDSKRRKCKTNIQT